MGAYYRKEGVVIAIHQKILTTKDSTIFSSSICRDNDSILCTQTNACRPCTTSNKSNNVPRGVHGPSCSRRIKEITHRNVRIRRRDVPTILCILGKVITRRFWTISIPISYTCNGINNELTPMDSRVTNNYYSNIMDNRKHIRGTCRILQKQRMGKNVRQHSDGSKAHAVLHICIITTHSICIPNTDIPISGRILGRKTDRVQLGIHIGPTNALISTSDVANGVRDSGELHDDETHSIEHSSGRLCHVCKSRWTKRKENSVQICLQKRITTPNNRISALIRTNLWRGVNNGNSILIPRNRNITIRSDKLRGLQPNNGDSIAISNRDSGSDVNNRPNIPIIRPTNKVQMR